MSINDKLKKLLERFSGGSISEKLYNYLGGLGYKGSLSDRLSEHPPKGGKGWQDVLGDAPPSSKLEGAPSEEKERKKPKRGKK